MGCKTFKNPVLGAPEKGVNKNCVQLYAKFIHTLLSIYLSSNLKKKKKRKIFWLFISFWVRVPLQALQVLPALILQGVHLFFAL